MSELTKDFLKFVMEVILFVIILGTLFSDQGIATNTSNFLTFVEPMLLQSWISSAMMTGSTAPGEFMTTTKTTGQAFNIKIFQSKGVNYVEVNPPAEVTTRTKFASMGDMPFTSSCSVPSVEIRLQKNLAQTVVIKKVMNADGSCSMEISAPTESVLVGPITKSV